MIKLFEFLYRGGCDEKLINKQCEYSNTSFHQWNVSVTDITQTKYHSISWILVHNMLKTQ